MPRQHLTPRKDPVPIVQEAGWASGPVWTGAENRAPPGFNPWTVQPVGSHCTDYTTRPMGSKYTSRIWSVAKCRVWCIRTANSDVCLRCSYDTWAWLGNFSNSNALLEIRI